MPTAVITPENLSTDFTIDLGAPKPIGINIGEGLGRDEDGKIVVNSEAFDFLVPRTEALEAAVAAAGGDLASTDYVLDAIETGPVPRIAVLEGHVAAAGTPLASQAYVNTAVNESAMGATVFTGVSFAAATAAGLAGTTVGQSFLAAVTGGDQVRLYLHEAGPVATLLATYPSMAAVTLLQAMVNTTAQTFHMNDSVISESDSFNWVIKDEAGHIRAFLDTDDQDGFGGSSTTPITETAVQWSKIGTLSWLPANVLLIFGVWGQSNADGVNFDTGDAIVSSVATYPTRALMVPGGPRITIETGADLVPLIEATQSGSRRESLCSGFANNLISKVEAAGFPQPYVAMVLSALTGTEINELNQGSEKYNLLMAGIRDCTAYALRNNLIPVYCGTLGVQGEAQPAKETVTSYSRQLKHLAPALAADAMAITGQADRPLLYLTQVATGNSRDLHAATWFADAPGLAQYACDGDDLIRLAGPMYHLPISSDDLHLSCPGQYGHGAQFAEVVYGEMAMGGWHAFRCIGHQWRSSTVLRLEFTVPYNGDMGVITGDAVTDTVDSVKGFQASGVGGVNLPISSVTVPASADATNISLRFVDITFTTAPAGPVRLAYAHRRDGTGGNGPVLGMRGLLGTVATFTKLIGGTQRHWASTFIYDAGAI